MAVITLNSLNKSFGPTVAVENLDLVTEDGEFQGAARPRRCG